MPHLQIDINCNLDDSAKKIITDRIKTLFSKVMDTGTDHIAISIREHGTYNLDIGRVKNHKKGVALVNADIREGRALNKRRDLALGFIKILNELANIPAENIYVTFSEHKGEDFHLHEKYLHSWKEGDDPLV
ncbi:MAG: tautomerase [Gammaproteobacteria bacterium]|nr:tautomerase [Gammaproteobacteria bacterium]